MMIKLLALLTGNPLYTGLALLGILAATNAYTGYKAYHFGAAVEKVACQKRVDVIIQQVNDANAKVAKAGADFKAALDRLDGERAAEQQDAEAREAASTIRIQEYEDELSKRTDHCPLSADDIKRLH